MSRMGTENLLIVADRKVLQSKISDCVKHSLIAKKQAECTENRLRDICQINFAMVQSLWSLL